MPKYSNAEKRLIELCKKKYIQAIFNGFGNNLKNLEKQWDRAEEVRIKMEKFDFETIREIIEYCQGKLGIGRPDQMVTISSIMKKDGYYNTKLTLEEFEFKKLQKEKEQEEREFKNSRIIAGIDEADDLLTQLKEL